MKVRMESLLISPIQRIPRYVLLLKVRASFSRSLSLSLACKFLGDR